MEKSHFPNMICKQTQEDNILMGHMFLTSGCLFYHGHVLSVSVTFEFFCDILTSKACIRQRPIGFKQELRRKNAAVINCSTLFS